MRTNKEYLEDLATSYQVSSALFGALESGLFDLIEQEEQTTQEIADKTGFNEDRLIRLLRLLEEIKLITQYNGKWSNMPVSREFLLSDSPAYLGLWIKEQEKGQAKWNDLIKILTGDEESEEILEVSPVQNLSDSNLRNIQRILSSLSQDLSKTLYFKSAGKIPDDLEGILNKISFVSAPSLAAEVDLIVILNSLENNLDQFQSFLDENLKTLSKEGLLFIIGHFLDFDKKRSVQKDLSLMVQNPEHKIYSSQEIEELLKNKGLKTTELIPLEDGLAALGASPSEKTLSKLNLDKFSQLRAALMKLGFDDIVELNPKTVKTDPFTKNLCDYGCRSGSNPAYQKNCRHHKNLTYQKTREVLDSYSRAFLLCGTPPTGTFQHQALAAQAEAFKSGFYKAFVYWAGPCSLCEECDNTKPCVNPQARRPSMEGAGIDVFATAKLAGKAIEPLREQGEFIHYFALLLLE